MRIERHGNDGEPVLRPHIDGSFQDVLVAAMHTVKVTDGHRGGSFGRPHARRRGVTPYTGASGIGHAESLKLGLSNWVFQTVSFKLGLSNWVFQTGSFKLGLSFWDVRASLLAHAFLLTLALCRMRTVSRTGAL